jgi:DNA-binding PadR family transcriptional regulator
VREACQADVNDLPGDARTAGVNGAVAATVCDHVQWEQGWLAGARPAGGAHPARRLERAGAMRMPLLALLAKEPAHGYELKTQLEQIFGEAYPSPNIGQIYVTLQRLERDGLVRSQDVVQATRPNKRVYELTEAGYDALAGWIDQPSEGPRVRDDFFMKLALSQLARISDRLGLITRQRHHCLGQLRSLSVLATTADKPIPRLLIEGAMLHLQADLDWLQRCQDELV